MNGQTYACSKCGCQCENVNATFVHIFTAHMHKDLAQPPGVALSEVERMNEYRMPWQKWWAN
ncbi:MAG: hypothetical protein BWY79_01715 [Actinobacteria bacterium ADurb.Bin444]|nr:MAG: hypothetical protein BWY79_01715 [Actinobacteria bacterium ADurb.Bin444]